MMGVVESTRVDRWLWAVRLTKTRPDAAAACRGGHVRVNDRPAKPSTPVSPGDEVRARVADATRVVEVVRVIQKRVGAADAVTCYLDRTPAAPPTPAPPVAVRDRGAGRPTPRAQRRHAVLRLVEPGVGAQNDAGRLQLAEEAVHRFRVNALPRLVERGVGQVFRACHRLSALRARERVEALVLPAAHTAI